jgi:PAS domain S-box-containing protein
MPKTDQTIKQLNAELQRLQKQIALLKKQEEKHRFAGDLYKSLEKNSQVGVYLIQRGKFRFVNQQVANVLGYTKDELLKMEAISIIHPEDQAGAQENAVAALQGKSTSPYEFRVVTGSGDIRWINETLDSINYRGKRAALGTFVDVTDKIIARQKFVELEALEATILESIPHAVIGLKNRRIIFANEGLYSVFGWKPEELVGQSTRVLYRSDEEYEHRTIKNLYSTLEGQRIFRAEFNYRHKNGNDIVCMVSASRIGAGLKDRGIVITFEDITERKNAEKELERSHEQLRNHAAHLESVREGERTRIARELHDELGQLLTALNMDLVLVSKRIPGGQTFLQEKVAGMIKLVEVIMESLKRISMTLRPDLLDHLGLAAAIEWQADNFQKLTGISCRLSIETQNIDLNPDLATAIYRIFQEALTNITRHASATEVTVSLHVKRGRIILQVKDNGRGITREQQAKPDAFGLIGIRERAYHWGGKIKITGKEKEGTTVSVSIPLPGKDELPWKKSKF